MDDITKAAAAGAAIGFTAGGPVGAAVGGAAGAGLGVGYVLYKADQPNDAQSNGSLVTVSVVSRNKLILAEEFYPEDTILAVRYTIEDRKNIPLDDQVLIHKGRTLGDKEILKDLTEKPSTLVDLILKRRCTCTCL